MLNPNNRGNTVISQSFIASEFQGFNDPFVKTEPTSSLNQFVRSKQTSDSGFIHEGENQSFGFGNITTQHEPRQLQSFSRKANEVIEVNVLPSNQANMRLNNANQMNGQQSNYNQKQMTRMVPPQQLQQRYVSPGIVKTESPVKTNQFVQQPQRPQQPQQFQHPQQYQQPQQPNINIQPAFNQPNQIADSFSSKLNQSQSQTQSQTQNHSIQQSRTQSAYNQNQYSQKQLEGSRASTQQVLTGSTVGKSLKLNVSQQFSNSFVLNCVSQPQKSSILQMKQRQREYRKSIQNFFL